MQLGMGIMAALCLLFGIAPQILMLPVIAPGVASLGFDWQVQMSWFGVLTAHSAIQMSIGAIVIMLSVLAGTLAYRRTRRAGRPAVSVFSGGEALPEGDRPGAEDFAGMAEHAFAPVYLTNPDPVYFGLWRRLSEASVRLQRRLAPVLEVQPAIAIALLAMGAIAGVWLS
jgi:multicomponent Na+:H+ antiporter subunit A